MLLPRVAALSALFATAPGEVIEQRRRNELIWSVLVLLLKLRVDLLPSSKVGDIEGQLRLLHGNLVDHVQGNEDVLRVLEDLQEAIFRYQVCL